jgi:hypothetical protein
VPNLSYFSLFSLSPRTPNALETILNASSAWWWPFLSGCVSRDSVRYAFLISMSLQVRCTSRIW